MLQTDVPVMFLDHGLNGTAGLPSADLTTFTGHTCTHLESLSSKLSFTGQRKLEIFLGGEAHRLHFVPGQHANATEGHANKWQKGNQDGFLQVQVDSLRSTKNPLNLLVATIILPKSGPENLQLIKQAFLVTEGSGSVHQHGKYTMSLGRGVGIETEVSVALQ
jgi:hypothetical protein